MRKSETVMTLIILTSWIAILGCSGDLPMISDVAKPACVSLPPSSAASEFAPLVAGLLNRHWSDAAASLQLATAQPLLPRVQTRPIISVSTVEELYAAVNNPSNKGVLVELEAGIYSLHPTGQSSGRLALQLGMDLVGRNTYLDRDGDGVWDPINVSAPDSFVVPGTETIIDASNLSSAEKFIVFDCDSPRNSVAFDLERRVIESGRGNRIARLTITSGSQTKRKVLIGSTLDRALVSGMGLRDEIVDCVLDGGLRGVAFGNFGCDISGFASRVTLERNVFRSNAIGIIILNVMTANARVHALLRSNRLYGNGVGSVFRAGLSSDASELDVVSSGNIYEQNERGLLLTGGSDGETKKGGMGNRLRFSSIDDAIWNNTPNSGVVAFGGRGLRVESRVGESSNNHVRLEFVRTRFAARKGRGNRSNTSRRDLEIFGAQGPGPNLPGSGNVVEILVQEASTDKSTGAFRAIDSQPVDPNNTNRVIVNRSDVVFEHVPGDIPKKGP